MKGLTTVAAAGISGLVLASASCGSVTVAFTPPRLPSPAAVGSRLPTRRRVGDKDPPPLSYPKTYDREALQPRRDVMDMEAARREFFEGTTMALEWLPLFQQMTRTEFPPSMTPPTTRDMVDVSALSSSLPGNVLPGIPTLEAHRSVVADFLDHVQASLMAIPVDESTDEEEEDDENDIHFVEEGRRMLVCGRFHVVPYASSLLTTTTQHHRLDNFEAVFGTCWNEVYHLLTSGDENTGSVILVPDGPSLDELRRFVDVNLQRPLQWMGLDSLFEVTSFQRGSPAIRLLYKLSDIPPTKDPSSDDADDEDN